MLHELLLLLLIGPAPSIGVAVNGLLKRKLNDKCKQYCESKRPVGVEGEFHADCEVPISVGPITANFCLSACRTNECYNCPDGNYVICPGLPTTTQPPPPPPDRWNDSQNSQEPTASWVYIFGLILGLVLLIGLITLCVFCVNKSRRHNMQGPVPMQTSYYPTMTTVATGQQQYYYGQAPLAQVPISSATPSQQLSQNVSSAPVQI